MRVTLLGSGTSAGVPVLGCDCEVCRSQDPKDKRMRAAAMIETPQTRVLIDSGPDIRMQLLRVPFRKLDGVLLTHIHYDHVAGIDDLRAFCVFGDINIYAERDVVDGLHRTMPYCFPPKGKRLYLGVPKLHLHVIGPHQPFRVGDIEVLPIRVMHDKLPILGYRFGDFAYITDMKSMAQEELPYLEGVKTMVINALRFEVPHHSHQLVEDAIAVARRLGVHQTYFTHVTHKIGLHDSANKRLPEGFEFGYDGLSFDVNVGASEVCDS